MIRGFVGKDRGMARDRSGRIRNDVGRIRKGAKSKN